MADRKREKQRHLGRGLQSLISPLTTDSSEAEHVPSSPIISNFPSDIELRESLQKISIDSISPNPYQARTVWNEQELSDLTESIRANGIIQPIIVRPIGTGFQLIANLPLHSSRQSILIFSNEILHRLAVPLDQFPKCPRQPLLHGIVMIVHHLFTNLQCSLCIPGRYTIQRDRGYHSQSPEKRIFGF